MAKVSIVMGSDSDLPVMSKAAQMLDKFGISYEVTVISAHRMPDIFFDYDLVISPIVENRKFYQDRIDILPFYRNIHREGVRIADPKSQRL